MEINAAALSIIKSDEGLELTAYQDVGGIWAIGYGHTGPDVVPGMTITEAQADALLAADVANFSQGVTQLVTGPNTSVATGENQFSAMVSLAYNIGLGAYSRSTLLKDHLAGNFAAAQAQFAVWDKAHVDGQLVVLPGLVTRRQEEAALYGTPDVAPAPPPLEPTITGTVTDSSGAQWTFSGALTRVTTHMVAATVGLAAGGYMALHPVQVVPETRPTPIAIPAPVTAPKPEITAEEQRRMRVGEWEQCCRVVEQVTLGSYHC